MRNSTRKATFRDGIAAEKVIKDAYQKRRTLETDMYGCTEEQMNRGFDLYMDFSEDKDLKNTNMAMSMLSDVQEQIERGLDEQARQYINRVKYLIAHRNLKAYGHC